MAKAFTNLGGSWTKYMADTYLVGGLKHFLFSIIYGIIRPIDFHMFEDG